MLTWVTGLNVDLGNSVECCFGNRVECLLG